MFLFESGPSWHDGQPMQKGDVMGYCVKNYHGRWVLVERLHDLSGTDYLTVSRLTVQDAAGLQAAGVPFVHPPRPGELPAAAPASLSVGAFPTRRSTLDEGWAVFVGGEMRDSIFEEEARALLADGIATMRPGSAAEVERILRPLLLEELRAERARLDARIAAIEAQVAEAGTA